MVSNREYIEWFFKRSYEKSVEVFMLSDKKYMMPKEKVHEYVYRLLAIPYIEFIDYIKENEGVIEDDQLTQSSSFAACSIEMCKALDLHGNPGMSFVEIGQLFPQYVKVKNESAFRKYGENQIKTSTQLGLTFEYYGYWYLSCLGYIYSELDEQAQNSLLARTILRIPLYHNVIIRLLYEIVDMSDYLHSLSNSTKGRRIGSILKMINICLAECRKEKIKYYDLFYPTYTANTKTLKMNRQFGTMQYETPSIEFSDYQEIKHPIKNNTTAELIPPASILSDVTADDEVREFINNMMKLYKEITIMRIVAECQKEYQERYYNMDGNDWLHLIGDYVRRVTSQPTLKDDEVFKSMKAG